MDQLHELHVSCKRRRCKRYLWVEMESLLMMGPAATQYTASWSPLSLSYHKVVSRIPSNSLRSRCCKGQLSQVLQRLLRRSCSTLVTNTRIRDAVSGFWRFFFFFFNVARSWELWQVKTLERHYHFCKTWSRIFCTSISFLGYANLCQHYYSYLEFHCVWKSKYSIDTGCPNKFSMRSFSENLKSVRK